MCPYGISEATKLWSRCTSIKCDDTCRNLVRNDPAAKRIQGIMPPSCRSNSLAVLLYGSNRVCCRHTSALHAR